MPYTHHRKSDGSLLITDKPMSRSEQKLWCALFAFITFGGIALCLYFGEML